MDGQASYFVGLFEELLLVIGQFVIWPEKHRPGIPIGIGCEKIRRQLEVGFDAVSFQVRLNLTLI